MKGWGFVKNLPPGFGTWSGFCENEGLRMGSDGRVDLAKFMPRKDEGLRMGSGLYQISHSQR